MSGRDLGASVRQRLLNQSRVQGRPFQELLQYFAMERFLYRLSQSDWADRFFLKGALLLTAWHEPSACPTMDIDLSGRTDNDLAHIQSLLGQVCATSVEPDGIEFSASMMEVSRIAEAAEYAGVRARFHGTLAKARIPMQVDIGFGDVITPGPETIDYPTLLTFPAPHLQAYPRETVVAEKLEALITLGMLNTRLKDYYDLALLAGSSSFDGPILARAITATFRRRETAVESQPVGLSDTFSADVAKIAQWRSFIIRSRFPDAPALAEVVGTVRAFALPVLTAIVEGREFTRRWSVGTGWVEP